MIELLTLLFLFTIFLVWIKLFAFVFKAGLAILSIPLQIVAALFCVFLFLLLIPFAVVTGILAVVFTPLLALGPLLPVLLIVAGLFLISRR